MKKPKHRSFRKTDEYHDVYESHVASNPKRKSAVHVRVSESEFADKSGTIYIDLEDVVGDVIVRWAEGTEWKYHVLPSRAQ